MKASTSETSKHQVKKLRKMGADVVEGEDGTVWNVFFNEADATDEDMELLKSFNQLVSVHIASDITGAGLIHLEDKVHLEVVNLSCCLKLADKNLRHLSSLINL